MKTKVAVYIQSKYAKDALSPLLVYIGGPDGTFAQKDHVYFAGEKVRKAPVILKDRESASIAGNQAGVLHERDVALTMRARPG